jgi:hypothetical protein
MLSVVYADCNLSSVAYKPIMLSVVMVSVVVSRRSLIWLMLHSGVDSLPYQ